VDGENGFLFGSEAEFEAKAERLLRDPGLRSVMGRRARSTAVTQFRLEGEIDNYLALYRSVVAGC